MSVVRGFEFRFYPTEEQKVALAKTFGSTRYVYNWALDLRSKAWKERKERIDYHDNSAALTPLKQELPGLNEVSCVPVQQSLRHLETAFVHFWKHGADYPAFKSKFNQQSAEFTRSGFRWRQGQLVLAKIGKLRIRWSRRFKAKPTTVTVSRTPAGQYYVSFRVDERLKPMPAAKAAIGIDLGLTCFAADSNGTKYRAPHPLRRKMAQLKRAQKALSRKKKGSKNRDKARIRVAKIHQKISDIRCDFQHKLSTQLVRENQTLVIEDLNVRGLLANHNLAGAIGDSGWSEFVRQLEYKSEWYGRTLIRVDRFFPSSKLCSACGFKNESMPLEMRGWTCPSCGTTHDRDINAARDLLAGGLPVNAGGGDVRPKPRKRGRGNCRRSRNLERRV